jgi:cilia- and flagella-associated protein 43
MLENEKERLKSISHEQIQKFNFKIGELLLFKMKIDAAICQEEMKLLRFAAYNYQRISYERKEQDIRNEMEHIQQQTNDLHTTSMETQSKILELRGNYENLNTKDKMLDKQFKVNFSEQCGSGVVDQAYKIFK